MTLLLEHGRNGDLPFGYWTPPQDPPRTTATVKTIAAARKAFTAWRDRNGLGGGNMTMKTGELRNGKTLIGRFSYNGRLWSPDGKTELSAANK